MNEGTLRGWKKDLNGTMGFLQKLMKTIDNNLVEIGKEEKEIMEGEGEPEGEREKRVYVPKDIWICDKNNSCHIYNNDTKIMNGLGQGLYIDSSGGSYSVGRFFNSNNGRNYYLGCVEKDIEKLEVGSLYFCTNQECYDFSELRDLRAYRILLNMNEVCYWDKVGAYNNYKIGIESMESKRYYYRILKEGEKENDCGIGEI